MYYKPDYKTLYITFVSVCSNKVLLFPLKKKTNSMGSSPQVKERRGIYF